MNSKAEPTAQQARTFFTPIFSDIQFQIALSSLEQEAHSKPEITEPRSGTFFPPLPALVRAGRAGGPVGNVAKVTAGDRDRAWPRRRRRRCRAMRSGW